jgi:hypothetical protein
MSRARRRRELSSASDAMSVSEGDRVTKKKFIFGSRNENGQIFTCAHLFPRPEEMLGEIGLGLPQSHLTELCVHVPVSSVQSIDTLYCSVTLSLYMYIVRQSCL